MPSCHRIAHLSPWAIFSPVRRNAAYPLTPTIIKVRDYRARPKLLPQSYIPVRSDRTSSHRLRPSPSGPLVNALRILSKGDYFYSENHPLKKKLDLSYHSPRKAPWKRYRKTGIKHLKFDTEAEVGVRLQAILASYITQKSRGKNAKQIAKLFDGQSSSDGSVAFSDKELQLLLSRRYDHNDVHAWASILGAENAHVAAKRLLLHSCASIEAASVVRKPLPTFVVLLFAKRNDITPEALHCLLIYTWEDIRWRQSRSVSTTDVLTPDVLVPGDTTHEEFAYPKHGDYPPMNDSSMFILIVRLLRQARIIFPEALVTITSMFIECFSDRTPKPRLNTNRRKFTAPANAFLFNRMLALLALPSTTHPFHSIKYNQRAQFDLLKIMARRGQPLAITREGYRAIIRVQVANKKTPQERDWANLKTKSWPPWKEEKTGVDADKGRAYGTSRAHQVLNRSREAGYGALSAYTKDRVWDSVALILSGWDIDGSPTIQTRALLVHRFFRHTHSSKHTRLTKLLTETDALSTDEEIWAARIKVTRTVHEAWACFLAYNDRNLPLKKEIYHVMLEKLAAEQRRLHYLRKMVNETTTDGIEEASVRTLSAGDRKELDPPPLSPKEATFVRIQPPSFHELALEMHQNDIQLEGPQMEFMLLHADTLEHGLQYLEWAKKATPSVESLLAPQPELDDRLVEVPNTLFGAFIGLLCRFPQGDRLPVELLRQNQSPSVAGLGCRSINGYDPLHFACRLLRFRCPMYRPPWHDVLGVLSATLKSRKQQTVDVLNRSKQMLDRWGIAQKLIEDMNDIGLHMDYETFRITCKGFEYATLAAIDVKNRLTSSMLIPSRTSENESEIHSMIDESGDDLDLLKQATEILTTGPEFLRTAFNEVTGTGRPFRGSQHRDSSESMRLPRLLTTPQPVALHAYVRTLGILRDWKGVVDTVRWMVKYNREIEEGIDMPRNGPPLLRRTIVAVRVFLEGSWVDHDVMDSDTSDPIVESTDSVHAAPRNTVKKARRLIATVEAWGGWPSDAEVEAYCTARITRFPGVQNPRRTPV